MADIANFADSPYRIQHPETYNWHFVDIPLNLTNYDAGRDCKADAVKGDCVIAALDRESAVLADSHDSADERLLALKLATHFVGDEHQPLHAEDNHDKGGNAVAVRWFGKTMNLHRVWDSGLMAETGLSEQGYAGQLNATLTKTEKKHVQEGTFVDWANEAHKVAQDVAYKELPATPSGTAPDLGDAYYQRYEWITDADRPKFSVPEWKLICDALNGTMFHGAEHLRMIWAEIADAIKLDSLDKKWDVNGAPLVKRLRELSAGQLVATIDVVEQFWIEIARGNQSAKVPGEA